MVEMIRSVFSGYIRNFDGLHAASNVQGLRSWFAAENNTPAGFGFNGDVIRTRIVADVFVAAGCTTFLETGTYRGATSVLAARLLKCPVLSCELNARSWLLSTLRCAPFANARVIRADSRSFLRAMGAKLGPNQIPFIYLDAHWYSDLPLQDELDYISATWKRCIVLVDDFQVPGSSGFKYDKYGEDVLCLEKFAIRTGHSSTRIGAYFPDYDPQLETGARCGFVLFDCGLNLDACDSANRFALSMLRRVEC